MFSECALGSTLAGKQGTVWFAMCFVTNFEPQWPRLHCVFSNQSRCGIVSWWSIGDFPVGEQWWPSLYRMRWQLTTLTARGWKDDDSGGSLHQQNYADVCRPSVALRFHPLFFFLSLLCLLCSSGKWKTSYCLAPSIFLSGWTALFRVQWTYTIVLFSLCFEESFSSRVRAECRHHSSCSGAGFCRMEFPKSAGS